MMTKLLESVSILALMAMFATTAMHWNELPERYPTHFNAARVPDKWGTKGSTLILPIVSTNLFLILTVVARRAMWHNVPRPEEQNTPETRADLTRMLTGVKAAVMILTAYVQSRIVTGVLPAG